MHLLARINPTRQDAFPSHAGNGSSVPELDKLFFKNDCLYKHNVMRINYTTYDVRRAQDIINPNTDHQDVMLLQHVDSDLADHQYVYARVLGIYHVNVIYTGGSLPDYKAQRMEFLWVRWFTNVTDEPVHRGWERQQLDHLQLLPVNYDGAFGFVDPTNVLRGAHLIPRFVEGKQHPEGKGISKCAQDSKDWCQYCVNW